MSTSMDPSICTPDDGRLLSALDLPGILVDLSGIPVPQELVPTRPMPLLQLDSLCEAAAKAVPR